jgi:hypothetical protein
LGKVLRVDVNSDAFPTDPLRNYAIPPDNPLVSGRGRPEIWAYGLRNPWRASFDRQTGALYIADVGQEQREEIDYQPPGVNSLRNYGWRCLEGAVCTGLGGCSCSQAGLIVPIHEYMHDPSASGASVTGGYVYRGSAIPGLQGTYFFADYMTGAIWSFRYNGDALEDLRDRTAELDPPGPLTLHTIASFGEDTAGELYIVQHGTVPDAGRVFKIAPAGFFAAPSEAGGP